MDADVIVVGAGLSGLVAAYEVAEAGHSVIIVDAESLGSLGGQAHWSFGGLFLVNSPEQRRLRIHDSEELALADWLGSAGYDRPEDHWPRRWAEAYVHFAAGEKRRWLHDLGVRWFPLVQWAERGGYTAPGHGNSVPRFHVTWGTGPSVVQPFADSLLHSRRVRIRARHQVTALEIDAAGVRVSGKILEPSELPRGVPTSRTGVGEFSFAAQTVVVASGGIGGNLDLVRSNWPLDWGHPPADLIAGVPDYVDGSMLPITEAVGGRLINADRMWHYPEGGDEPRSAVEPPRHPDPGRPVSAVAGRARPTLPRSAVPRLRLPRRPAPRDLDRVLLLLVRARPGDAVRGIRPVRLGAERRFHRQGPAAAGRPDQAGADPRGSDVPRTRRGLPDRRFGARARRPDESVGRRAPDRGR